MKAWAKQKLYWEFSHSMESNSKLESEFNVHLDRKAEEANILNSNICSELPDLQRCMLAVQDCGTRSERCYNSQDTNTAKSKIFKTYWKLK